jgi:hypothetical protein
MAKIMRTSTKWSDCGPEINMFFASVSYTSDLTPFQGASPGWAVPRVETRLKPWAESCSPSGAIKRRYADTPIRRYASPRQPKEIASL